MKEYIKKMRNQLKEDGIPLYLATLTVTGIVVIVYMLIVWFPSWLSPEQCNEVPSFGTPFFYWITGVTGVFLVLFMIHAIVQLIVLLFSFSSKLPANYSSMTYKEIMKYHKTKAEKRKKRKKIANKFFICFFAIVLISMLTYISLSNYHCWR